MIDRIKTLISYLGLSTRAFAINCGLRQNTLSNQLNGMRELSLLTVHSILVNYSNVSAEWLMRGNGDMFITDQPDINGERLLKLVDTIATLQDAIKDKANTIQKLQEHINKLESQLKTKLQA